MSTINDTDVFLVNRGTASYKCPANQLRDKAIDTDFLLVNRGSTSYNVAFSNAKDVILDTDWLLINRGATSYKVSGADFKDILGISYPPKTSLIDVGTYDGSSSTFDTVSTTVDRTQPSMFMCQKWTLSNTTDDWYVVGTRGYPTADGYHTPSLGPAVNGQNDVLTADAAAGTSTITAIRLKRNGPLATFSNHLWAAFLEHPGFLKSVKYTGNGAGARTISHDLEETPGFIILLRTGLNSGFEPNAYWAPGGLNARIDNATDSNFTVQSSHNVSDVKYTAYIFGGSAESTNGNGDGNIKSGNFAGNQPQPLQVTTGFAPKWGFFVGLDLSKPTVVIDYGGLVHSEFESGKGPIGTGPINFSSNSFYYTTPSNPNTTIWYCVI